MPLYAATGGAPLTLPAAEQRRDQAALATLLSGAQAGAYVIGGDLIVLKKGQTLNDPLFTFAEAQALGPASETVFLGHLDGAGRAVPRPRATG